MEWHWYLSMNKTSPGNVGRTMFVNFSYSEKWCGGLQSWSWIILSFHRKTCRIYSIYSTEPETSSYLVK